MKDEQVLADEMPETIDLKSIDEYTKTELSYMKYANGKSAIGRTSDGHGANGGIYFADVLKGIEPPAFVKMVCTTSFKIKIKEWDYLKGDVRIKDWSAEIKGLADTRRFVDKLLYLKECGSNDKPLEVMFKPDTMNHERVRFTGYCKIDEIEIEVPADGIINFTISIHGTTMEIFKGDDIDIPATILECIT